MINQVVLVGRLTKDPEIKYTTSGKPVAHFTLAINRPFTDSNGERNADFINCSVWGKMAQALVDHQKKGNLIGITGRIQTGSYEGRDGKRVYTTEVVADSVQFYEPKQNNENKKQNNQSQQQGQYSGQQQQYGQPVPYQQVPQSMPPYQQPHQNPYGSQQAPYNNSFGAPQFDVKDENLPF